LPTIVAVTEDLISRGMETILTTYADDLAELTAALDLKMRFMLATQPVAVK
jgi:hypothetical protein